MSNLRVYSEVRSADNTYEKGDKDMRINEVEKLTSIKEANLKFYEREGLINPNRNENGYRDYSDDDIRRINQIKTLRMLEIPITEIKRLFDGEVDLDSVLEMRLKEMNREAMDLDNRRESCRRIINEGIVLSDITPEVLSGSRDEWSRTLAQIIEEDVDKRFIFKGIAFMIPFAVVIKLAIVLNMDIMESQDLIMPYFGGMVAIFVGIGYSFMEGLTNQDFLYCWGRDWGGSALGGLTNSYSVLGIGIGLAGITWPMWGCMLALGIILPAIIRMALMHITKEAERQNRKLPVGKYMLIVSLVIIAAFALVYWFSLPAIKAIIL